jgi:two-component system phosphate regulon response regulator OmpR
MKKNILIVDDDKRLRELLKDYLTEKNLEIYLSEDYEEAKDILSVAIFDLIILDRMMPSGDGIKLIDHIKQFSNTPVIMLTAMGENKDKVDGLKIGADDYLSKPFEPEELFLRITKLLYLFENLKNKKVKISFGEFTFDTSNFKLQKNDELIYLTEGENNLLIKLINKKNDIVLREELAEQEFDETELRKVDVQITRLRHKIEINAKQPQFIKTIRGKGYKLICSEI